jgi:hypothetical protein
MNVRIHSVPQHLIRSNQVGDWWYNENDIAVHVLETMSPDSQLAVAIHELIEAWECRRHGITDKDVTAFDDQYEAERKEGKHRHDDEPGDDPRSPYRREHAAATHVERAVCAAVNLTWTTHSLLESGLEAGHPRKESPASEPVQ